MTLLECTDIKLDRLDLVNRRPANLSVPPRPAGIHQSGVLLAIAKSIPSIAKKLTMEIDEEEYPLIWALGQMWEEFCVGLYPEIEHQPGPVEKNGIWRSADGLGCPGKALGPPSRIEEFKFTFVKLKSGEDFLDDWLKMHQGRAYLSGYSQAGYRVRHAPPLRQVRWHVLYVRGDYKSWPPPVYRRYLVEFTDKEIADTEKMLCANKGRAVPE